MSFSCRIAPTLPAINLDRARKFYENKLGLKPVSVSSSGIMYDCGAGTAVFLYQGNPSKAKHVVVAFEVENIKAQIESLKRKGVTFEEHNMPGIDTLASVAAFGPDKAAWFKDSEGNILALIQVGLIFELDYIRATDRQ